MRLVCGLCILLLASVNFAGWGFSLPLLYTWGEGLPPSNLVTNFVLLLVGWSFVASRPAGPRFATLLSVGAVLVATAALVLNLGITVPDLIDHKGTGDVAGLVNVWRRMSWVSSLCLTVSGIAAALSARRRAGRTVTALGFAIGAIAVGQMFALDTSLDLGSSSRIALPTAFGLLTVAIGLVIGELADRQWSLSGALGGLVLLALLPAVFLSASTTYRAASDMRTQNEQRGQETARFLAQFAERVVGERAAILATLAHSSELKRGDIEAFHRYASSALAAKGGAIVLIDKSRKMVMSTTVAFGTPLPPVVEFDGIERVLKTGELEVSNLFHSPFDQIPLVSILMPVRDTDFLIRVTMRSSWLSEQLSQIVPHGWRVSLVDRNGLIIARSSEPDVWIGKAVLPIGWGKMLASDRGTYSGGLGNGQTAYFNWHKASVGWYAVAIADHSIVSAIVRRSLSSNTLGIVITGVFAALLVAFAVLVLGSSLQHLAREASRTGNGAAALEFNSRIREITGVGVALRQAAIERQVVESNLRENEKLLQNVLSIAGEGIWDWDIEQRIITHNAHWCWILGLDQSFLQHGSALFVQLVHPDDLATVEAVMVDCLRWDMPYACEYRVRRADGEYVWVQDRGKVVERDAGRARRMIGSLIDINERKLADQRQEALLSTLKVSEAEARRQEKLFRSVFDGSPDCMIITDIDANVLRINPAHQRVFNYVPDDIVGKTDRVLYPSDEEWQRIGQFSPARSAAIVGTSATFKRKDGESFPGLVTRIALNDNSEQTIAHLCIIRDVTEQQRRDEALQEKRNLEALGRLTGGIAHDFNNLLTIISANLQLIEFGGLTAKRAKWLHEATAATEMGARLNQRLMTFAKQSKLAPVTVDLNNVVAGILDLVRRTIGETTNLDTSLCPQPAVVRIDVSEMENAIINLALNAKDAMPRGGTFKLTSEIVTLTTAKCTLQPGRYVCLRAADTGTGMTEEVRSKAFQPFYSTKGPGRGTGLGLATIHGFVTQSGGLISIESTPGLGSTVTIWLPLHLEAAVAEAIPEVAGPVRPVRSGTEVLLLVEDNDMVRNSVRNLLMQMGWNVIVAADGGEALKVIDTLPQVDVVVSDVVMPGGLSGYELLEAMRDRNPDLKFLLVSGFPDPGHEPAEQPSNLRILRKPFTSRQLTAELDAAMA